MRITSSYGMELTGDLTALETSVRIYRQALSVLIPIINDGWEGLSECEVAYSDDAWHKKLMFLFTINQRFQTLICISSFINKATLSFSKKNNKGNEKLDQKIWLFLCFLLHQSLDFS